jgi:hypothetical protein
MLTSLKRSSLHRPNVNYDSGKFYEISFGNKFVKRLPSFFFFIYFFPISKDPFTPAFFDAFCRSKTLVTVAQNQRFQYGCIVALSDNRFCENHKTFYDCNLRIFVIRLECLSLASFSNPQCLHLRCSTLG